MVSTQDEFENEVVPNWGAFSQARANQQANSAPNEALADTGLYDHLEDDESSQDGRGLRIFLTMLLIIVLALVVAAVVWFVVLDGGSTNAPGPGATQTRIANAKKPSSRQVFTCLAAVL